MGKGLRILSPIPFFKSKTMKLIRQIVSFLKKLFWTIPTDEPEPLKATEVKHLYTCIKYRNRWVNLRNHEVAAFEAMARSDKRAMALRFEVLAKKGKVKFIKIDGKMTCIKIKKRWK